MFIVDDVATNLAVAADALEDKYRVITLPSAEIMFAILEKLTPDLILLDVDMPVTGGFEALKRLKANTAYENIPVIFLTALDNSGNETLGIELGAVDFITKPFSKTVLRSRIKMHLDIDELIRQRTKQLTERTEQLFSMHHNIVFTLADLLESRDGNTGGHIDRTSAYLKILAEEMLLRGVYADTIGSWNLESFVSSARLHDLGKIAVSDAILNKPGPLTDEETSAMELHPMEGERVISQMINRIGENEFLSGARLTAAYHHEKWDGTGYPYGLKGTEIPLEGRIMTIVDVYDALTSVRPYKEALSHTDACQIIAEGSGSQFDPKIVEVFLAVNNRFPFN